MGIPPQVIVKGPVVRILIVATNTKRLLLVESGDRPDQWELPGGKLEKFETCEAAAVRELEEETGIIGIPLTLRHSFDKPIPHDQNIVWRYHFFTGFVSTEVPVTIDGIEITAYRWAELGHVTIETNIEYASQYFLQRIKPPRNRHT